MSDRFNIEFIIIQRNVKTIQNLYCLYVFYLKLHNFEKYAWDVSVVNQGSPYDYASIMHYETNAFGMDGKLTMIPRRAGVTIGSTKELSPIDIAEVRQLYGCDG
jgi:hypothetical protein